MSPPFIGRWTLDVGRWALDVGRWTLDVGRWALGVGRWTLDVGRWTRSSRFSFQRFSSNPLPFSAIRRLAVRRSVFADRSLAACSAIPAIHLSEAS
jgi:hypothetical protein